jgi:formylglycine-generating enzyme
MKTAPGKNNTLSDLIYTLLVLGLIGFFTAGFVAPEENRMVRVDATTLTTSIIETDQHLTVPVNTFLIDKDLVTVREFETFVKATGYVTEAEKFGDAGVFEDGAWTMDSGATFR